MRNIYLNDHARDLARDFARDLAPDLCCWSIGAGLYKRNILDYKVKSTSELLLTGLNVMTF
jgi:hypothetical protein